MTLHSKMHTGAQNMMVKAFRGIALTGLALVLSGCSQGELDPIGHVGSFSLIDPLQRHPIIVSEEPANLSVHVSRGSDGLSPHQRANFADFLGRYRGRDTGNGRLSISVPSGSANEIAALKAVADMRSIVRDYGIDDSRVSVSPYRSERGSAPSINVSYNRFVAQAPECGTWHMNVANDPRNLPHPNLGCATQRALAMQVANPADLLGPRTMTPATAERRDARWEKFNKGEATIAKKDAEEKASVKQD